MENLHGVSAPNTKDMKHGARTIIKIAGEQKQEPDVPCGTCHACCIGYEINFSEGDDPSLFTEKNQHGESRLPSIGPEKRCVYLVDSKCSVYDRRPIGCRRYDCRVIALSLSRMVDKPHLNKALSQWDISSSLKGADDLTFASKLASLTRHIAGLKQFEAFGIEGRATAAAINLLRTEYQKREFPMHLQIAYRDEAALMQTGSDPQATRRQPATTQPS